MTSRHRSLALLDWDTQPEECWKVTSKLTTVLAAMGRADEAEALYDRACVSTTLPKIHLHAAYGRAMLYTRFLPAERRDRVKAKSWINTAIALASQLPDAQRRAFMLSFHENGLALIETYLGDPRQALDARRRRARAHRGRGRRRPSELLLHRSVLRYNRAQLLSRMGRLEEALAAYCEAIAADPNQSEYYLERATCCAASAGRARRSPTTTTPSARARRTPSRTTPAPTSCSSWATRRAALAGFAARAGARARLLRRPRRPRGLLFERGDLDAARAESTAGLDLDPGERRAAHAARLGRPARGARRRRPRRLRGRRCAAIRRCAAAWSNRATLWFEQGDVERAIERPRRRRSSSTTTPTSGPTWSSRPPPSPDTRSASPGEDTSHRHGVLILIASQHETQGRVLDRA